MQQTSQHVLALAGVDPDSPKQGDQGNRISFADYHDKLFRIGTGWLGWSPSQTWASSTAEILAAYEGHLEKLRAVNGGAEADAKPNTPDNAAFDREGLHGLSLGSAA